MVMATWRRWLTGAQPPPARWVVLDVETSGLDPHHDRLLAVAAVAVCTQAPRPTIVTADSFEAVLRQPACAAPADKANILLHGIGVGAQGAGVPAAQALAALHQWAGLSPVLAFHAAFDRTVIERACRAARQRPPQGPWLDLEPLAAVLHPDRAARSLDEWMALLGIRCAARHQAAADVLATAELLLKLWPDFVAQRPRARFADARALAAHRRWLGG